MTHDSLKKEIALQMYAQREPAFIIAARVGVHPATITRWAREAGISRPRGGRPLDVEKRDAIAALYSAGTPVKEICRRLDCSTASVNRVRAELELSRNEHVGEEEGREFVRLRGLGYTYREIGEITGRHRNTVANVLKRQG